MMISRSSRRPGTALAMAVLISACNHNPSTPETNTKSPGAIAGEPPPISRMMAANGSVIPAPAPTPAPVEMREGHPDTYTVMPGDTLWNIAARFLKNPWQWRQIWRQNPQVGNPNRIYPGDVLRFSYSSDGNPQLELAARDDGEVPLIKLSPEVRTEALSQPIPPVPRAAVESFLTRAQVLNDEEWARMPYIVGEEHDKIAYSTRDRVYARGAFFDAPRYQVYRPGKPLREPGSNEVLGTAGIYMGEAVLEREGDPASFFLENTLSSIYPGDRLLPVERNQELLAFDPHPVPPDTEGAIIARLDPEVTQISQFSSVILNLGHQEGVEPGHVVASYAKPRTVKDPVSGKKIALPGEQNGLLMIYKVHDLVSYALVMQAERPIHIHDRVMTP